MQASLSVHFYYCKAKLCESVLDADQADQGLVPPFIPDAERKPTPDVVINSSYIKAVQEMVSACHCILITATSLPDHILRGCPTATIAKSVYALKALSTIKRAQGQPNHPVSRIVDGGTSATKMSTILNSFIGKLDAAAGTMRCRVPSMILGVVYRIGAHLTEIHNSPVTAYSTTGIESAQLEPTEPSGLQQSTYEAANSLHATTGGYSFSFDSSPSTGPVLEADGFDMDTSFDMFALSDFEHIVMPEFSLQYSGYPDFPYVGYAPPGGA